MILLSHSVEQGLREILTMKWSYVPPSGAEEPHRSEKKIYTRTRKIILLRIIFAS